MSKINNKIINNIVLGLGILAVATLGVTVLPAETNAYRSGYELRTTLKNPPSKRLDYNDRPIVDSINPNPIVVDSGATEITIFGQNFVYGAVAKLNNSDRTTTFFSPNTLTVELSGNDLSRIGSFVVTVYNPGPGGGLSNGYIFNVVSEDVIVVPATTTKVSSTPAKKSTTTPTAKTGAADKLDGSELVAGAIFGGDGFLPSGLIQWLILAILILLLIIIARKIYGEKKYHATPLKHA